MADDQQVAADEARPGSGLIKADMQALLHPMSPSPDPEC